MSVLADILLDTINQATLSNFHAESENTRKGTCVFGEERERGIIVPIMMLDDARS